jgi:serine/threonine protein kinase
MDLDERYSNDVSSVGSLEPRVGTSLDDATDTDFKHPHSGIQRGLLNVTTMAGDAHHDSNAHPANSIPSLSGSDEDFATEHCSWRTEEHRQEGNNEQHFQSPTSPVPDGSRIPSGGENKQVFENSDHETLLRMAHKCICEIQKAQGYEEMFETSSKTFRQWQSRLCQMLKSRDLVDEPQRYRISIVLALILEELGHYETSQTIYESLCILSPSQLRVMNNPGESHKLNAFAHGLEFLVRTERDSYMAEEILKMLPWVTHAFETYQQRWTSLFSLIVALNCQKKYQEASWQLRAFQVLFPDHKLAPGALDAQVAISRSGQNLIVEADYHFMKSLIASSLENGPWHRCTLKILFHYGKALRTWGHHDSALNILMESCKGLFYYFGPLHPISIRAYEELKSCASFRSCPSILRYLGSTRGSKTRRRSIAYEHIHLRSVIEVIRLVGPLKVHQIVEILGTYMTSDLPVYQKIEVRRLLAYCKFQTEDPHMALQEILEVLYESTSEGDFHRSILRLDSAIFAAMTDKSCAEKISLVIFGDLEGYLHNLEDQDAAVYRRLTAFGLTHFIQAKGSMAWVRPSEAGPLGQGSQALVCAVTIGTVSYARKSIFLNPRKERSVRKAIRNEVENLKMLDHPHIVQVILTYEEQRMFHIVMRPLADCDLKIFLEREKSLTFGQVQLGWRWIGCLASTLAFIHSKGIRHKDIKPRNILVAGERILFSDFGSCHAFLDDGDSTTDGPAFGHTVKYCAPEIIAEGKRSRSADVFSLGCVFAELLLWVHGHSVPMFHEQRTTISRGSTTNAYYATLDNLELNFHMSQSLAASYKAIVKPMIKIEPGERLTAFEASKAISRYYLKLKDSFDSCECQECYLKIWVEDDADVDFGSL